MAKVVTVSFICDDADEFISWVDGMNVIDHAVEEIADLHPVIEDAIANGTYEAGDGFDEYIIFAPSEHDEDEDDTHATGYWSNEWGWGDMNLATRFEGKKLAQFNLPLCKLNDAVWIRLEP